MACRSLCLILVALLSGLLGFSTSSLARTITWSGFTWDVKNGSGLGPGPNNWSDSTSSVWVDGAGDLHLKIRKQGNTWYSSQVTMQNSLGYGNYEFRLKTNTETFDPRTVLGLFTYENDTEEIDIELTRWGNAADPTTAQYATQPSHVTGNRHRFDMDLGGNFHTHIFNWSPSQIQFTSLHGHHSSSPPGSLMEQWTYTGPDVPVASGEKVRINFWLFQGIAPTNGLDHEVVVSRFYFTPAQSLVPEPGMGLFALAGAGLLLARRRSRS